MSKPIFVPQSSLTMRMYLFGDINRNLFSQPISVRHLCRGGVRTTRGIRLDLGQGGVGAIVQGGVLVGDTVAIDLRLRRPLYRSQNPLNPGPGSLTDSLLRFHGQQQSLIL